MGPILPIPIPGCDETDVDLVNQLRGLQGVALALTLHQVVRQASQVGEHDGEELVFGLAISVPPLMQEMGNVAHFRHIAVPAWTYFTMARNK